MALERDVKKLRNQVIQNLDQAQESLSEAHLICHEKLYPTWQTVDQDIQILMRSIQALSLDLKRRNSDTAVLKEPETEPVEPLPPPEPSEKMEAQPVEPALKSPEMEKTKPGKPEPTPQKKQKAKAGKSSPASGKKPRMKKSRSVPERAEKKKTEAASESTATCPWCDSQQCEIVDAQNNSPGGSKEKVLVCLECGQTYSASTLENS